VVIPVSGIMVNTAASELVPSMCRGAFDGVALKELKR
jgi:hypothetical protein